MGSDFISLDSVRRAIEIGLFPDFDSFEYVLLRLSEQARQELLAFEAFAESRYN